MARRAASYPFFTAPTGLAAFVVQVPVATIDGNPPNGTNTITGQVYGHVCTGPDGCALAVGSAPTSTAHMAIQGPAFVPYQPVSTDTNQAQLWTVAVANLQRRHQREDADPERPMGLGLLPERLARHAESELDLPERPDLQPEPAVRDGLHGEEPAGARRRICRVSRPRLLPALRHDRPGRWLEPDRREHLFKTMTVGASQSAAFLHGLIFYGFNEDEDGRIVFDGAWPQIDGRMMVMNIRWGQPNNLMYLYMGGDEAPVWWADYPNLARGLPARRHASPLHRDRHLPADPRDPRLGGTLLREDACEPVRLHLRRRHSAAAERVSVLFARRDAWRRRGQLHLVRPGLDHATDRARRIRQIPFR